MASGGAGVSKGSSALLPRALLRQLDDRLRGVGLPAAYRTTIFDQRRSYDQPDGDTMGGLGTTAPRERSSCKLSLGDSPAAWRCAHPGCTRKIAALTVSNVGRRQPQRVLAAHFRALRRTLN